MTELDHTDDQHGPPDRRRDAQSEAVHPTTCYRCFRPIRKGDAVEWSTKGYGPRHAGECPRLPVTIDSRGVIPNVEHAQTAAIIPSRTHRFREPAHCVDPFGHERRFLPGDVCALMVCVRMRFSDKEYQQLRCCPRPGTLISCVVESKARRHVLNTKKLATGGRKKTSPPREPKQKETQR